MQARYGSDSATIVMSLLVAGTLLLAGATIGLIGIADRLSRPQERVVASYLELESLYDELGYRLAEREAGELDVPRAFLAGLSATWATEVDTLPVARKKDLFFRTVLPLVLRTNELILDERRRALAVIAEVEAGTASRRDRAWLVGLATRYRLADDGELEADALDTVELLRRVDVIPVSLALGQSAYESGWATSRFAGEGNALYGQWTWNDTGIKPKKQRAGMGDYRVAAFETPLDSVHAYAHNLNTHRAYREFRRKRAAMRAAGAPLGGLELADTLTRYSERGGDYVRTLKQMMRANGLPGLDTARLRNDHRPILIVNPES